jgi:hypothetical protein
MGPRHLLCSLGVVLYLATITLCGCSTSSVSSAPSGATAKLTTVLRGQLTTGPTHHTVEMLVIDANHSNGDPSAGGTATVLLAPPGGQGAGASTKLGQAPVRNGHAIIKLTPGDPGLNIISIRYSGDATHCANTVVIYSQQHPSGPVTSAESPRC